MYLINIDFNKKNTYANTQFLFKKKELSIDFKDKKNISFKFNNKFFCLIDGSIKNNLDKTLSIKVIFNTLSKLKKKKELENFLNSLRGEFHLFFYSFIEKNFLLVGDIDGWKQIFYKVNIKKSEFFFSPVPNLIINLQKQKSLNKDFFIKYIMYRYNFVYGKKDTFFKDLYLLETGKYLYGNSKKFSSLRFNYFKIKINNKIGYEESKKQTYKLIKENFNRQKKKFNNKCILALSGGLDSTSAAVFLKEINKPVHSFTAKYEVDMPINEFRKAKLVAKKFCKSWSPVSISSNDFLNFWKTCYNHHDFPLPTSSSLGYAILYSKISKLGYKSIINAGVPDNLFLGNYQTYLYNLCDLFKTKSSKFNHELRCWIKNHSTKAFPKNRAVFKEFYKKNIVKSKKFTIQPKIELVGKKYLTKGYNKNLITDNSSKFTSSSFINAYQIFSVRNSDRAPGILLNSEIEKKTKVISIDPFVGEKLQNYTFSLPSEYKIKNSVGKVMLREMMKKKLPDQITTNKSKTGFDVPFQYWIKKNKKLKEFVLNNLKFAENTELFKFLDLKKINKDIKNDCNYNSMFVWQLINSIMWLKKIMFI
jgi:asparagine synthase (glutamine-hydrolysing)